ncbi:MAG TPA: hypothetical protein VHC68_02295 [Candidatus Paceibacterota bacterium]|nr:hypothetical protein [Candidatus Paceibacterota bacterium]
MPPKASGNRIYLIAGAIAAVLIAGFALSVPHLRDAALPPASTAAAASATPVVYLHDAYKKGTHTISGKVLAADPCVAVTASASVLPGASSSTPATILVGLDMPPDTGICLAEPATTTFSVTASAGSDATLAASINGTDASTTEY